MAYSGLDRGVVKPDDLPARFLALRLIHFALVSGLVMFGVVLCVSSQGKISREPDFQNPFCQVAIALSGGSVLLAANLQRFFFHRSATPPDLTAALQRYSVFFMIRAACIEGGAVFAAVVTFLTHNILPFGLLAFGIAALAFYRPSRAEFERLMGGGSSQEWQ